MKDESISWKQIGNWSQLIVTAVSIALAFATIDKRLALVEQKLDTIIAQVNKKDAVDEAQAGQLVSLSQRISTVEVRLQK